MHLLYFLGKKESHRVTGSIAFIMGIKKIEETSLYEQMSFSSHLLWFYSSSFVILCQLIFLFN